MLGKPVLWLSSSLALVSRRFGCPVYKAATRARPEVGKERLMEPLTDGILIALFLWATVAVIKKGSWKKPEPSCHVYIRQGDDKPVADC